MPGFDGTGPLGRGSRTGWGRGWCPPPAGTAAPAGAQETGAAQQAPPYPPQWYGAPSAYGPIYGVGRGGIPRGCGRGFCGGRRRGGRFFW